MFFFSAGSFFPTDLHTRSLILTGFQDFKGFLGGGG